jgi:SAM-dependent methyltransferase
MISIARAKKESRSARGVEFRVLPFDQVSTLEGKMFDGVFSNMGGLNCLADLRPLAESLAVILKPGALFIATLLSDFCLWETVAFLSRLNFREAFRRQRSNGSEVSIHGNSLEVFFHSPSSVRNAFSPFFRRSGLLGLNIFTPPPSSVRAYQWLRHRGGLLESLDNAIAEIPPFNRLGDHFVIALRRY